MLAMQEDIAARLGRALVAVRGSTPQLQLVALLAGKIPNPAQNWISRRENGEVELKPSEICAIEEALGAPHGTIYKLAGLIEPDRPDGKWVPARKAIENDPLLNETSRRIILGAYDGAVKQRGSGAVENGHEDS